MFDLLLERLALVVLRDDEHLSVGSLIDIVYDADVVVLEGRRGLGLLDEPLLGFGIRPKLP